MTHPSQPPVPTRYDPASVPLDNELIAADRVVNATGDDADIDDELRAGAVVVWATS